MAAVKFILGCTREYFSSATPLYKYLSLEHTLLLLKRGLWLSSPNKWNDPFETLYYSGKYVMENNEANNQCYPLKNRVFCACFTTLEKSEAYWKVYANENTCTRLTVNSQKLIESL